MNTNEMFRKWPLNNLNNVKLVENYDLGILSVMNPPSPSSKNNVEANPIKSDDKWNAILSSSDVIASKKRVAIGTKIYYTKNLNVNKKHLVIRQIM
jgi:hypothetical protein